MKAAALALAACACLGACGGAIRVAFPSERQRVTAAAQTYLIGAVPAGRAEALYVNGATATVHRTGAFLAMVDVRPGTNRVTLAQGSDRLVRTFIVSAPPPPAPPFKPIVSDADPRLGAVSCWRATGASFLHNRVRADLNDGATIYYLPKGFSVRGAPVKGTKWVAVWVENVRGYMEKRYLARDPKAAVPPRDRVVPDPARGFPDRPPYGRRPADVRILVDAGHGGTDTGALAPHGWCEKDVNLAQARAIRDALEKAGFSVYMTRDDDSFPPLMGRPLRAWREKVDAFISVHHNATAAQRDPRLARHTTTYASTSNGLALARAIQRHVGTVMAPVRDAGAQMKSLAVCRNPAVPSCLIEVDFINLPEGEAESWDPVRQKKVAEAVTLGVLDWMTPPAFVTADF